MKFFGLLFLLISLGVCDGLRVGTYNIRVPVDGPPNDWAARRPRITSLIEKYNIDILAIQEAGQVTVNDIVSSLSGYCIVDQPIFDNAIIYKCDIPLITSSMWAISSTPSQIGSNTWGLAYARTLLFAKFMDGNTCLRLYATHLDIIPKDIQQTFIIERLNESPYKGTAILVGDFNTDGLNILKSYGFVDTSEQAPTFNGFGGYGGAKIDYILAKDYANVTSTIIYDTIDGYFPSDHALMIAEV